MASGSGGGGGGGGSGMFSQDLAWKYCSPEKRESKWDNLQ